jgi:hypothetical protein
MRSKDLVHVALKFITFYFIIEGITQLWGGIMYWTGYLTQNSASIDLKSTSVTMPRSLILIQLLSAAFLFGMAHFIWVSTPKIVKYIFPADHGTGEDKKGQTSQIKAKDLQGAAFTIVGIFIFSQSFLYLFNWIESSITKAYKEAVEAAAKNLGSSNTYSWSFDEGSFLLLAGILIYLIFGIVLIVRGRKFSQFISKINTGAVTLALWLRSLQKTEKPRGENNKKILTG